MTYKLISVDINGSYIKKAAEGYRSLMCRYIVINCLNLFKYRNNSADIR